METYSRSEIRWQQTAMSVDYRNFILQQFYLRDIGYALGYTAPLYITNYLDLPMCYVYLGLCMVCTYDKGEVG